VAIPVAGATHKPDHNPGGGTGGGGTPASRISISASPTVVDFGRSTVISGKLTGSPNSSVAVELQGNAAPFTGGFKSVSTKATDSNGDYSFTTRPGQHVRYRVVAKTSPPSTSAETLVRVRIRVSRLVSDSTPRRGQVVRFSGSAYPAHDGRTVFIKRRSADGVYRTVARTVLRDAGTARSSYSRRLRIRRSGTYRVRVAGDADHLSGNSTPRTLIVR